MVSPFLHELESRFSTLTPREIEICGLIRNGYTTKQIAGVLSRSVQTVLKQRKSIRKKLRISNRRTNLASYLKSFERPAS
jgi:DNA-binding CsgD family transcriptional regulator